MTTRRSHSCNLCHGTVVDGAGIGLRWGIKNAIELTVPSNAETHVCQQCVTGLEIALADQRRHHEERAAISQDKRDA